ncbi:MAG TPA: DUF177 domain-containing protein [Clostridiales bacterium]|jgi:uncharacterized protein|nr:DUF177 domain-containing protein [Clostridiales bacterium]HQP70305.1 DUF177 domain-containing protein [Clostridiales bacterium]
MNIKIDTLKEGDNSAFFTSDEVMALRSEDIDLIKAGDLKLNIQKNGNYLHITGSDTVEYRAVCDRCAEEFTSGLIVNIDYFFHIGEMNSAGEGDIEIVYPDDNNGMLEFDGYFIESFFLAQPLRFLCKEDCRGLCQKCGADLNKTQCGCKDEEKVDPRWEKLTELIKKNQHGES